MCQMCSIPERLLEFNVMDAADSSSPAEYNISMKAHRNRNNGCTQYRIGVGWPAAARGMQLRVGDLVQLEPVCRDPWRLRLSLLPPDDDVAPQARS